MRGRSYPCLISTLDRSNKGSSIAASSCNKRGGGVGGGCYEWDNSRRRRGYRLSRDCRPAVAGGGAAGEARVEVHTRGL